MSKMTSVKKLITEHLDIWLTAETEKKSGRGRSSSFSNSIYGVQKLRELILELAFLGKLVPNQAKPVDLLEQILSEQKELVKNKILKKTTDINIFEYSEFNYSLPKTWVVLKLCDSGYNLGQKVPDSKFSYIDVSAINSIYGRVENQSILNADEAPSRARKKVTQGTIIYSTIRPYLNNIAVIDKVFEYEPIVSTAFAVIHPYKVIDSYYLFYYLRSPLFVKYVESQQIGIAYPAINDKQFFSGLLPVPPLDEQQRIVAKVDELMHLCDQLEQQQNLSSEAHDQLVNTLLNVLTNSFDVDEFQQNWQRISESFDLLFTTEYSIDQLKQTILQLAVMGKLVKQDPNDEPASELLKHIVEKKARLVKDGVIKKSKFLPEKNLYENTFTSLPDNWILTNLANLAEINPRNNMIDDSIFVSFVPMTLIHREYLNKHEAETKTWAEVKKGFTHFANNDIGVAKITPCFENSKACVFQNLTNDVGAGTTELHIVRPIVGLDSEYVLIYFKSPVFLKTGEAHMTGTAGQKRLPKEFVEYFNFPLPPLNEQKRIVEKVNQLFFMINTLQTLQGKLQRTKLHLLDSLIANALSDSDEKSESKASDSLIQFEKKIEAVKQSNQKSAEQIDLFVDESVEDDLKLLSLAAEITFQLHTEPTFGHLKLQKLIYLCQQLKHMDLAADFKQHAAGPYDRNIATYIDTEFKKRQWFSYHQDETPKYKQLRKCGEHKTEFNRFFKSEAFEIYELIGWFRTCTSSHIEIVATLFACWLRLLEQKQLVTEEQLLCDFYAWSEEKSKFSKVEVLNGYKWMKQNSVVPL